MTRLTIAEALQLAQTHRQAGRDEQSASVYLSILQSDPQQPSALYWLGELALKHNQFEQAIDFFRRAAEANPRLPQGRVRLGFALLELQRLDEAQQAFQSAIDLQSDCADAHYGLSWVMLARGDFENGWRENEWRLKCAALPGQERKFTQPRWDGSELNGKTLLVYQEQGYGDVIQYSRYIPLIARSGGRVIVGCGEPLWRLMKSMEGVAELAPNPDRLPYFDLHLSLHSLPWATWSTLKRIPADVPYLHPDDALVQRWRRVIGDKGLRVGLCWQGNPKHQNDRKRSIDRLELRALANIPGVRLFSLQKGLTIAQARRLPAELNLLDFTADLKDLADTAAAMMSLDVVISVDTSLAHLAGAVGRPVWTLLPFHADWRWMVNRSDSPWYPTMRLFRQPAPLDWAGVLLAVREELQATAKDRA